MIKNINTIRKEIVNKYPDITKIDSIEFEKFIQDKKIILVGPAGYLVNKKLGNYIDKFDIIVRVNHGIYVESKEDYGSRTDILYHILSRRGGDGIHKNITSKEEIKEWKNLGLKWLVSRHDSHSTRIRELRNYFEFEWMCLTNKFYRDVKYRVGKKNPNTGILALVHLLTLKIKSLHIIGFDFYRSGVYQGYGDIKEGEDPNKVNERWHDTQSQIRYLKTVIEKYPNKLFIDEVLKNIINDSDNVRA
jgi:hypothetical protein